jgi:hypothetical protein
MEKKSPLKLLSFSPHASLLPRILNVLKEKQYRARLLRMRVFATTAILSVAALVPVAISLVKTWAASNADTYISLVFTDGLTYWKVIAASLADALPAVSLMLTLALLATFLWSVRRMISLISADTGVLA